MTVNELIAQLEAQRAHGRGEFQAQVRLAGRPGAFTTLVATGLPEEAGEAVAIFAAK